MFHSCRPFNLEQCQRIPEHLESILQAKLNADTFASHLHNSSGLRLLFGFFSFITGSVELAILSAPSRPSMADPKCHFSTWCNKKLGCSVGLNVGLNSMNSMRLFILVNYPCWAYSPLFVNSKENDGD